MKGLTFERQLIDVVEEYDYDTQYEQYNRYYKNWRKNKQNPFAFNFEMNRRESVYIEGKGFKVPSLLDAESEVIGHIMHVVGIAMLMWVFIDNIIGKAAIQILGHFGIDIHANFLSDGVHGGPKEIVTFFIAVSFLKVIVPAVYMKKVFKVPKEVRFMNVLNHPADLLSAIAMSLAVSVVSTLPNIYNNTNSQLYNYFSTIDTDVSAWGQTEFVVYTIYDIIILSIITELFFHGALFAPLRQFGDFFAIGITAAIAGLLSEDLSELPAAILITLVAGVGMVRSGSIYTAFFVRIIYKMYKLAIVIIETDTSASMYLDRSLFMLAVFVSGVGTVLFIRLISEKRECYSKYYSEIPESKRVRAAVKAYPFPVVACLCILAIILKQVF
ncbi:MAG TPA: CPBP family intramembrane metalloprotease [Ruminococcus flavefaciens]|nr:CPBP family intramembrane metalloprotease [Ruminococcus flavefaciens]